MTLFLTIIILLSMTIMSYMFWIMFGFNSQFVNKGTVDSVNAFLEAGGLTHLVVLLLLAMILLILFGVYAYKDSKRTVMYDNGYEVTFDAHDNLFSKVRIAEYIFIVLLILNFVIRIFRLNTLHPTAPYPLIFQQDFMMLGFEFMAVYTVLFIGFLVYELIKYKGISFQ